MTDVSKKVNTPSVRLYVTDEYKLPQWWKTASTADVCVALSIAATLMPVLKGEVPPGLRVQQQIAEAVTRKQRDLQQSHEKTLQSLVADMKANLTDTKSVMQSRIDELVKARDAAVRECETVRARAEEEMTKIEAELQSSKKTSSGECVASEDQEKVRTHFRDVSVHTTDMFSLLSQQGEAIKQLSNSLTQLRAREMAWYRCSKRTSKSIPWASADMQLPFEGAYEHAIGRSWNNMTASKLKELEHAMGKEAARIAIEEESPNTE